jgi:HAD superfamily hydrolase (TIGR01509 family)
MRKAVIFDFDGLLVDTEIISYRVYKELLNPYGYEMTIQDYAQNYSGKTERNNVRNLISTYKLPWGLEEGMEKVLNKEKEILAEGVNLKKGAIDLLHFLKENGYKTAIATSSTKDRAVKILKDHCIYDLFDEFVFAEDITRSKPNPDVFLKAVEKLQVDIHDCFVLEDSESGIEASVNAGIPVICIPDIKKPDMNHQMKAAAVFDSLYDVIGFFQARDNEI